MDNDGNKERMLNCPSSVNNTTAISEKVVTMATSSGAMFKSPQGGESLYDPGWDPNVSWSHSEDFGCSSSKVCHDIFANSSYPILLEKLAVRSTSHLICCWADPNVTEMLPKLPIFGSGSFSKMVESFGLTGCGQTSDVVCPRSFTLNKNGATEDSSLGAAQALGDFPVSKDRLIATSPNGKRRAPDPPSFDLMKHPNTLKNKHGLQYLLKMGNNLPHSTGPLLILQWNAGGQHVSFHKMSCEQAKQWVVRLLAMACVSLATKMMKTEFSIQDV